MSSMNLLGAVRLSSLTEETTSPERQREQITLTAQARGDPLVYVAEDLDVSGALSPFDREGLGPWLSDPARVVQWDGLVVAKLDRLTRSLFDFQRLIQWCQANGKTIISVSESIDFGTPVGRLIANILVMFAEFERERIRERRRERAADDKRRGWYGGGTISYGYMPVKVDSHWELKPNPAEVAVIERMARDIIAGKSSAQIVRDLITEGVPTARGGEWRPGTILGILRDPDCPIDAGLWRRAKDVLDGTRKNFANRYDGAKLLNIALCVACKAPLWGRSITKTKHPAGKVYRYYRCSQFCDAKFSVRQEELDNLVADSVVRLYGKDSHKERHLIPGSDKSRRIAEIDKQIDGLDKDADDYDDQWLTLRQERRRVKDEPAEPDRWERVPTGETVAEHWHNMATDGERRQWLLDNDVKVYAGRNERKELYVVVDARMIGGLYTMDVIGDPPGVRTREQWQKLAEEMDLDDDDDDWEGRE